MDADFSPCAMTPGVQIVPGTSSAASASGAFTATIQSVTTAQQGGGTLQVVGIGISAFTVAVTPSTDGLTMSLATDVLADPIMPMHMHGGSTIPAIMPQGGAVFAVTNMDFFMAGWWQLYLDLQTPAGGPKDRVTFDLCVPN
jgi:hypothetical protein